MNINGDAMVTMTITTSSPEETKQVGEALGKLCRGGEVLLLNGDLGSGKTCFVQGLARGLEVRDAQVSSPTFTIHAEYEGRLTLNHLDLYRLDDPVSQTGLGIDELFARSDAVAAVEWPEMLADPLTGDRLEITFTNESETRRRLDFTARGASHRRLIEEAE